MHFTYSYTEEVDNEGYLKITGLTVVPTPGLVWHRKFTPRKKTKTTCSEPCLKKQKPTT